MQTFYLEERMRGCNWRFVLKTNHLLPIAFALVLAAGCAAKTYHLTTSPTVPAAAGKVQVTTDKNGNETVKLEAEHLAKPASLTPPRSTYVVWIQRPGNDPENQGQMKVGDNLKGNFQTVTPYKNFDIFVTAEQDGSVKTPSGEPVLRATVQS